MPGKVDPEHVDDSLWFTQTDPDIAAARLKALGDSAMTDNQSRRDRAVYNASLLDNIGLSGFGAWGYGRPSATTWGNLVGAPGAEKRVPLIWNYAAAGLDTAQAKIVGQDEPKPMIVVTDGDYDDHIQSVWSGRLLEGIYRQDQGQYRDLWDLARAAWKIAAGCTGTTAIKAKPMRGERKMVYELHDTLDMFIDFFECSYSMPLTYGEQTWFDPYRLMACTDDKATKEKIWKSREPLPAEYGGDKNDSTPRYMVKLYEGWRLAMSKNEPGTYLSAVKEGALDRLDYPHTTPPFAFMHARRSLCGFYGLPLMERGMRIVERINQILSTMDNSERLIPRSQVIYDIEATSPALIQNMRNAMLLGYSSKTNPMAKPPVVQNPDIYADTVLKLLEMHIRAFHETLGINSNEMGATRPQGVVAAVAIRAVADLFTQLFAVLSRDFIKCLTSDLGTLTLREVAELKGDDSIKVTWDGGKFTRNVNSSLINLKDKQFTCSVAPTGGGRGTPADRISLADEMLARKEISEAGYQRILETGDVASETAPQRKQNAMIAKAMDKWMHDPVPVKQISPLPWMNLAEAMVQVMDGYMGALMIDDFPPERELYFRRYITLCDQLLQRQAAAKAQLSGVARNFKGSAPAEAPGAEAAPIAAE